MISVRVSWGSLEGNEIACMICLRYYQISDHSKTFILKACCLFPIQVVRIREKKKKTKHKVQTASRHFEYYDLFWWHYKLASYQNISLSPSQDAKHRKSGLRKSLPRGFFHYQCLSSMLKNMREPEEETFATVSNKQLWCTRNLIKQTKRSVFF